MQKEKDFKENVVKIIDEKVSGSFISRLRLVRWDVDGKKGQIKLEKRNFTNFNGQEKMGKLVGLTKDDWELLLKLKENISEIFG